MARGKKRMRFIHVGIADAKREVGYGRRHEFARRARCTKGSQAAEGLGLQRGSTGPFTPGTAASEKHLGQLSAFEWRIWRV